MGDEKIQEDLENEMNAAYEAGKLTTRDLDVIYKGVDKTRTLSYSNVSRSRISRMPCGYGSPGCLQRNNN